MKRTVNVNLAGLSYVMDEDAYAMLHDYVNAIGSAISDMGDSREIQLDIEARVSEHLNERLNPGGIVTIDMIGAIIDCIGRPGDFCEGTAGYPRPTPPPVMEANIQKRLFRNPDDRILGGVCSGIAEYIGIDPTWVRLGTVALGLFSGSTAGLVYLILWIVVPEAQTPLQKMQMKGERQSINNIGDTVRGMYAEGTDSSKPSKFGSVMTTIAKVLITAILCLVIAVFGLFCVSCLMAFFASVFALVGFLAGYTFGFPEIWTYVSGLQLVMLMSISFFGIFVTGIPCYLLWRLQFSASRSISRNTGIKCLALCILCLVLAIICLVVFAGMIPTAT